MKANIGFEAVTLKDGFWKSRQKTVEEQTIYSVYNRFSETGRIDAFRCEPQAVDVHFFWDSDVAKWIESVAYITRKSRNETLEKLADEVIGQIEKNQLPDGYFNSYFLVKGIEKRFSNRKMHELYCAGHFIEAAIAYKQATGKDKLYRCMLRYADLIDRIFRVEKSALFFTPGHQEIELALVKLYRESRVRRYLALAKYFLEARGGMQERGLIDQPDGHYSLEYAQDDVPVREQNRAKGHAVRLLYMCAAMADVALECGDDALKKACENIFEDLTQRNMYVTGGVGPNCNNEGFDIPWNLPNEQAYNETCASIAMCLFAARMQVLYDDSKYADVIERELYNGMLSGISLDGKSFFYENPLEIRLDHPKRLNNGIKQKLHYPLYQRAEVFQCSCCPPNLTRLIPSIGNYAYTVDEETVWVQQYLSSETDLGQTKLVQTTDYPVNGNIKIRLLGKGKTLALRIPWWCERYSLLVNRIPVNPELKKGYLYVTASDGDVVELQLEMTPFHVKADPRISETAGKCAIQRGPIVYCAEAVDNSEINLSDFCVTEEPEELFGQSYGGVPLLAVRGIERKPAVNGAAYGRFNDFPCTNRTLCLIPYFAFANRGESDMRVWLLTDYLCRKV